MAAKKQKKADDKAEKVEYLSSPKEFHLEMPLYLNLSRDREKIDEQICNLLRYSGTIDAYCIWCGKESVFTAEESYGYRHSSYQWKQEDGFIRTSYACTRDMSHRYYIYFLIKEDSVVKIGQHPSVADFQIPQAEKYRKILGEKRYKELTKGIGLAAHGAGIGSFVYLRRVFEKLIEDAHVEAKAKRFSEIKYMKSRMNEKIIILKQYLPEFLVENSALYGILSKGIHELDEDECLKYFDTIKIGIEQILDEKLIQKEKEEKTAAARKAIQVVSGEIGQSKDQPKDEKVQD